MIEMQCPSCRKPLRASPKLIGKRIRCKSCQNVLEVTPPSLEDRLEEFFESDAIDGPVSAVPVWSAPAAYHSPSRREDDINLARELREQMREAEQGGARPPEWKRVEADEFAEPAAALDSVPVLGWFDFSFNYFAAPVIIRIIWFLIVISWALGLVGYTAVFIYSLVGSSPMTWMMPLLMYAVSLVGSILGLLVARVLLEFGIVMFRQTGRTTDAL